MNSLVMTGGVIHGVVNKSDSTILQLIREMELIEDFELVRGLHLRLFARLEGANTAIHVREVAKLRARLCEGRAHSQERHRKQLA